MATTGIYTYVHTLSLLDARPILIGLVGQPVVAATQIIAGNSTDVEAACSLEYPSMLDLIEALLSPGCVANVSMLSVDEGGGRGCVLFDATGTVAVIYAPDPLRHGFTRSTEMAGDAFHKLRDLIAGPVECKPLPESLTALLAPPTSCDPGTWRMH